MPTISVKRDALFVALGKTYTEDEFQELCFDFGLELDEVTTEKQMLVKEQGGSAGANVSEEVLYRIDIPANRYDLLCLEGLVQGLLIFQSKQLPPTYTLTKYEDCNSLRVTPATAQIRPYAVAAILRNITFTKESYDSFIDLQDKLHQNLCRKRTLVAIGTHDLDTIQGPFVYDALPPEEIFFKPLNESTKMTGTQIMEFYSNHPQLKQYLDIIRESPVYPVIKDSNGVVLSMPPIINGDHSKITLQTKNVFIECTATDLTKANIVLDTLVCMFARYCRPQHHVQQCRVQLPAAAVRLTPALLEREELLLVPQANRYVGTDCSPAQVAALLTRMCLAARADGQRVRVRVPPSRKDVIHACDLYEDLAIAYGYNRIPRRACVTAAAGSQQGASKLTEQLRHECARCGYTEALTFTLCSREDVSSKLGVSLEAVPAVLVANPKTQEFQLARPTLLPGLLRTLAANKSLPLPLSIFEISDVVLKDDSATCGARNSRRLCAVRCGKSAGFQHVHGLLDRVLAQLRCTWPDGYRLRVASDPTYFPGRCADVLLGGRTLGRIGVLHPDVLAAFDLTNPCSAVEINIDPFV